MNHQDMVSDKPDPVFRAFLEHATQVVSNMPEWQRGNLQASMRATNSVPRPALTQLGQQIKEN